MSYKILSIGVPSYNMEAYLGKYLDSLLVKDADGNVDGNLMQTLEVLVINDGSKTARVKSAIPSRKNTLKHFASLIRRTGIMAAA